jgi:hypothetical protein
MSFPKRIILNVICFIIGFMGTQLVFRCIVRQEKAEHRPTPSCQEQTNVIHR